MHPYLKKLQSEWTDDIPVKEVLYRCYRELHLTDSREIREQFSQLNDVLGRLTLQECDRVWDLTCALCSGHEREGFLEGVSVGTELAVELLRAEWTV